MRFRIRGPSGQATASLPDDARVADLVAKLREQTSIEDFDVAYSYPPLPLKLDQLDPQTLISQLNLNLNGEQLLVSAKHAPQRTAESTLEAKIDAAGNPASGTPQVHKAPSAPLSLNRKPPPEDPPEVPIPSHAGTLVIRIMPDDNSCLFRAFNSAYLSTMDNMHELRSLIAQAIQADPEKYSSVVLEKAPDDYCRWIQSPDAWGGQVELEILSKHFAIEICSIDVQTLRVDRYNQGMDRRCILVYSGIHYDVIALTPSEPPYNQAVAPPEFDEKIFDVTDAELLEKAVELCRLLQQQGYFTDTTGFQLKCNVCQEILTGEMGATAHAAATGHTDFGET